MSSYMLSEQYSKLIKGHGWPVSKNKGHHHYRYSGLGWSERPWQMKGLEMSRQARYDKVSVQEEEADKFKQENEIFGKNEVYAI